MNLLDRVCTGAWAIRPEALEVIIALADRQDVPAGMIRDAMHHRAPRDPAEMQTHAVSASRGTPIEGASVAYRRGSVAVLPITGPIVRYGNLFTSVSGGATSVQAIGLDLNLALADPDVKAIMLHVDSPGGESNGIAELSDMIFAARGRKAIVSYVSDLGASAGYWLASAASEIAIAQTAALGSIGVVAAVQDPEKHDTGEIEFVSSVSPHKRLDPRTKVGKAQIQALVDTLGDIFVGAVARNRGVTAETVTNDFGQGGLLVGQDAVRAGLADRLGSFEGVLADLAGSPTADVTQPPAHRPAAASTPPVVAIAATTEPVQEPEMGLRERILELAASLDPVNGSADLEASIVSQNLHATTGGTSQTPPPPTVTTHGTSPTTPPPAQPDVNADALRVRLAAAEAENQRLRLHGITDAATRYAQDMLREGRAMPSEEDAITGLYIRAALDDMYTPVSEGPSRVALVQASYAARQARTQLLAELTDDAVLRALHDRATAPRRSADGEPPSDDRTRQLLEMTPLGRRHLDQVNGHAINGQGGR
jgi:ClpP class serine protease